MSDDIDSATALTALRRRGVAASGELQALLGKSQPTLSRVMQRLATEVVVLGSGRSTRYAAPAPIHGLGSQQPLVWTDAQGRRSEWGRLSHIQGERLHVSAPGIDLLVQGRLPWFLAPLRPAGFLGRLLAQRLALYGADANPERWSVEQVLFAALHTPDSPGALTLGDLPAAPQPAAPSPAPDSCGEAFDALAADVAATAPFGSSAGGEQAKFLGVVDGRHVLVKFSPPRGTPFGERWHDLLHAEHLAHTVLGEHGVPVASTRLVETAQRTYLESTRFDRIGAHGRRHVVPLDAVHDAFVPGARQHWGSTCEALARQRRLPAEAPAQARALLAFGRLIGNADMHFGNLSLFVEADELARGRFTLAPVYDMLPMRWRPDPAAGSLDLTPFTPAQSELAGPARPVAVVFWRRVAEQGAISRGFRALARDMSARLG